MFVCNDSVCVLAVWDRESRRANSNTVRLFRLLNPEWQRFMLSECIVSPVLKSPRNKTQNI